MVQRQERIDTESATLPSAVDGRSAGLVDMEPRFEQVLRPPRAGRRRPVDGTSGRDPRYLRGQGSKTTVMKNTRRIIKRGSRASSRVSRRETVRTTSYGAAAALNTIVR